MSPGDVADCGVVEAHNVRYHQTGIERLRHPVVGELELYYEGLELSADSGLMISGYAAEPGSRSEQSLLRSSRRQ